MNKQDREDYILQKKCLLVVLFVYYINDIPYDAITLRSFGFNFDPSCNFKAIVVSKKEHIHKYVIHILNHLDCKELANLDNQGYINIVVSDPISSESLPSPKEALNVYFNGVDFKGVGFIEGKPVNYTTVTNDDAVTDELLYHLNKTHGNNSTASSFIQWLLKFYTNKLHTDLVMGAGINEDYGAKNWEELINVLNAEFYKSDTKSMNDIKGYVGKELFTSSMVLKTSGFDIYKSLNHELYEFKEAKSFNDPDSTLYKCVDCIQLHPDITVITYNYDTNLEYLMKKRGLKYCTIYDDNSFVTKDTICDIYHVHGLLPYAKYNQTKYTDSLVFNETDYYYLYNNPYSWSISKQLHDFKFNTCIFIGISLTDPDMKRLLELADNYLKFNFIFVRKKKGVSDSVLRDITTYFFTFDLITIWINDYDEIGGWLKEIKD
jgi:hypothetical protein